VRDLTNAVLERDKRELDTIQGVQHSGTNWGFLEDMLA
jgi:hypothetical protein